MSRNALAIVIACILSVTVLLAAVILDDGDERACPEVSDSAWFRPDC